MSTSLGQLYEAHHRQRRNAGDFVFVPERIPFFQAAIGTDKHVLDLGCRSGALTRHFLDGNDVVGIDVDRAALARAEELGITPVVADVDEPLPVDSEAFDAVVAGELLEHVRFPGSLVAEVRRVLRPGGVFVGSVPNAFRLQNRLRFLRGLQPERDLTHLHMFTPADIRALLGDFTAVRIAVIGGRYRRLHARLLAQDVVFSAVRDPLAGIPNAPDP